jgi:hypothetical protein
LCYGTVNFPQSKRHKQPLAFSVAGHRADCATCPYETRKFGGNCGAMLSKSFHDVLIDNVWNWACCQQRRISREILVEQYKKEIQAVRSSIIGPYQTQARKSISMLCSPSRAGKILSSRSVTTDFKMSQTQFGE